MYVLRSPNSALPLLDKFKYLVPIDLTVYHFAFIIRKRIKLNSNEAMFLYCNGQVLKGDSFICQLHAKSKDEDGFLYIVYCEETVMGSHDKPTKECDTLIP